MHCNTQQRYVDFLVWPMRKLINGDFNSSLFLSLPDRRAWLTGGGSWAVRGAQAYLVGLFEDTNYCAIHAKRSTIMARTCRFFVSVLLKSSKTLLLHVGQRYEASSSNPFWQ